MAESNCPFCEAVAVKNEETDDYACYECPECGTYKASLTFLELFPNLPGKTRKRALEKVRGIAAKSGDSVMLTSFHIIDLIS